MLLMGVTVGVAGPPCREAGDRGELPAGQACSGSHWFSLPPQQVLRCGIFSKFGPKFNPPVGRSTPWGPSSGNCSPGWCRRWRVTRETQAGLAAFRHAEGTVSTLAGTQDSVTQLLHLGTLLPWGVDDTQCQEGRAVVVTQGSCVGDLAPGEVEESGTWWEALRPGALPPEGVKST